MALAAIGDVDAALLLALMVTGAGAGRGGRPTLAPLIMTAVLDGATGLGRARWAGRAPRSTGTPAAHKRARAAQIPLRPLLGSKAMAVASGTMRDTRPVNTVPLPTSMKTVAPALAIARISSTKRTGARTCSDKAWRMTSTSSLWAAAVVLANTGTDGACMAVPRRDSSSGAQAASTSGE